ncbi:MAG: response regulator [Pseudodesulfovibrio sp.]
MALKKNPAKPTSYVSLGETSRALLDSSVEAAYVLDVSGYILAANDAAAKLFGMTKAEEFEQLNIYDLLPESSVEKRRAKTQEAIDTGKSARFEEEVANQSLVHSIVPVPNPWGEVSRLAVSTLDLTELRRSDEDLRREQQRQIFFMESLPGIVYHLYPDKSIRYANRYFRKYFGSPKGRNCQDALHCTGDSCTGCPPMDAMEMDRAVEWDWTDTKGRTFHLQCSPMTDSSSERMIMVLGIDITARKRAEDALKKAHDKLEDRVRKRTKDLEKANSELTNKSTRLVGAMKKADSATRAKSSFLANMSHEIRTPLNAVLGMAELALREADGQKKNDYLKRVMEAGNSLLSVINDVLDFSKIEARKLTLEAIDFDIRRTISSALDIHRLQAMGKGLNLTFDIDENVPQALVGDPSRLRQVIINLVSNAIKFTETGGIDVSLSLVAEPATHKRGDEITVDFAIADTGIGIPSDKQLAIFKSFLQADDSVTRKHGGTGLGLAICTLLVELMHGNLSVTSSEGNGSTFSFSARFNVGDPAAIHNELDEELDIETMGLTNLKVLLADDNELNRELASTLLIEQGFQCVSVENGVQALEAVKNEAFDIILMDVQMPIMDGISATRAIRNHNSGALDPDIPIVALTAHALKGDRERFLEAGMNDYIAKPIKLSEFYATIVRAMDNLPLNENAVPPEIADSHDHEPYNRETALEMLSGRKDLLARMDEIFMRDVPAELEELQGYVANRDWQSAKRLAHSIKGSARTVGAQRAGAVAEQLEFFCKQKDEPSAKRELKTLEGEVQSALQYIKDDNVAE